MSETILTFSLFVFEYLVFGPLPPLNVGFTETKYYVFVFCNKSWSCKGILYYVLYYVYLRGVHS